MAELWEHTTDSPEETMRLGRIVAAHARAGDLIALIGELGAGKTQFVRGLAAGLGVDEDEVASPTFVMVQEHVAAARSLVLVHIDAYRLHSMADLESVGWDGSDELRRGAVIAVEWADRLGDELGDDVLEVRLSHAADTKRHVILTPRGSWIDRFTKDFTRQLQAGEPPRVAEKSTSSKCPACGNPVPADAKTFPFCNARCRMADLGKWLGGQYKISRPIEHSDLDEE